MILGSSHGSVRFTVYIVNSGVLFGLSMIIIRVKSLMIKF